MRPSLTEHAADRSIRNLMPSSAVFSKFKSGQLRSGGTGNKVTNRKQAIAIFESEKRKEAANGGVYPERKGRAFYGG
jgi:hypothetical protein